MSSLNSNLFQMQISDGTASDAGGGRDFTQREIDALHKMKEEISNIPHSKKSVLVHVQRTNPALVDDHKLLNFLETESFDAKLASQRLARYWEARLKLFGPDNCFLPMTLTGAMRDSIEAVNLGYLTLLPCTDKAGRPIMYCVTRKLTREYYGLGQVRVWWYLIHLLMENPIAIKRGFVVLSNAKDSSMKYMLRKRLHVPHTLEDMPLLGSLARFDLTRECLPHDLGGTLILPRNPIIQAWTIDEGGKVHLDYYRNYDNNPIIDRSGCTETTQISYSNVTSSGEPSAQPTHNIQPCDSAVACLMKQTNASVLPVAAIISGISSSSKVTPLSPSVGTAIPCVGNRIDEDSLCIRRSPGGCGKSLSSIQTKSETSAAATSVNEANYPSHPGRTGDPRMNRAVQAKLENPDMPLITALVLGGFVFPGLDESDGRLGSVTDTDNVTGKWNLPTKKSAVEKIKDRKTEERKDIMTVSDLKRYYDFPSYPDDKKL
ncbi:hypothetical protein HJC23_004165 [Cyclotella cryptica]|uniref:CRAL-TRIO domain-containing protein n=1 Tax=Cyclotella cryptica TaxID=29204 RepID=A0ABD3NZG7_9STRA